MNRFLLFFCVFLVNFVFAQCSLDLSDTTHVKCNGDYSGSFSVDVSNAVKPYSLNLSNGVVLVNGQTFTNLSAGDYEVALLDANFCADTINVKIKEPSALKLNVICVGNDLHANVEGGVMPYDYYWRDSFSVIFSTDSIVTYSPNQFYDFELIDFKGCRKVDSVFLFADFSVDKLIGDVPLSIQVSNNSSLGDYFWDFGDGESSTSFSPTHEYENVGTFDLNLTLTDEHQCFSSKVVSIEAQGFNLSINDWENMHNAFSPNGDGINDSFTFEDNNAILSFKIKVFNRWGALVYDWSDPNFKWRGTSYEGENLSQGVYYYYMTATGVDGKIYEKKGSISLYY